MKTILSSKFRTWLTVGSALAVAILLSGCAAGYYDTSGSGYGTVYYNSGYYGGTYFPAGYYRPGSAYFPGAYSFPGAYYSGGYYYPRGYYNGAYQNVSRGYRNDRYNHGTAYRRGGSGTRNGTQGHVSGQRHPPRPQVAPARSGRAKSRQSTAADRTQQQTIER